MPSPPGCQELVGLVANLRDQEQALLDQLLTLDGADKWKAMQDLGTLRAQLAEQQLALADCEKQHASDLTTEIDIIDLPGASGTHRIGRLWQLTADGQALKQTASIQNGLVTFLGVLGAARQSF